MTIDPGAGREHVQGDGHRDGAPPGWARSSSVLAATAARSTSTPRRSCARRLEHAGRRVDHGGSQPAQVQPCRCRRCPPTPGETGLSSPAVVNDVVFISTSKPAMCPASTQTTGACRLARAGYRCRQLRDGARNLRQLCRRRDRRIQRRPPEHLSPVALTASRARGPDGCGVSMRVCPFLR